MWFRQQGVADEVAEAVAAILNAITDDCSGRTVLRVDHRIDDRLGQVDSEDALIAILWAQTPPEALVSQPVLNALSRQLGPDDSRALQRTDFFALFREAGRGRPQELFDTPASLFRWLVLMTRCEATIFELLQKAYPTPTTFVHHMMDMENYYPRGNDGKGSYYPFDSEQLLRVRELSKSSGGRLLTFVAFDPKRPNWRSVLETALDQGCRGVKFYPPNGYHPSSDPNDIVRKRIADFFEYCAEKRDIPVFTHCTPKGFEAKPGTGALSNPDNFLPVLQAHPSLRLCFGHAGGGARWFGDTNDATEFKYGEKVIELCLKYPNVYAEVGYLEEILNRDGPRRLREVLESLVENPQTKGIMDKLMYGTDWHMIFRLREHRKYLARFADALNSDLLRSYSERFFGLNALRFLKFTSREVQEWRRAAR